MSSVESTTWEGGLVHFSLEGIVSLEGEGLGKLADGPEDVEVEFLVLLIVIVERLAHINA